MPKKSPPVSFRRLSVVLMTPLLLSLACVAQPEAQESNGTLEAAVESALDETFESAKSAAQTYELSDLHLALKSLASAEAWGEVIHIDLPSQANFVQMTLARNGVDFYSHGHDVDLERFREEAARLSLTPRPVGGVVLYQSPESQGEQEDSLFVEIRGDWSEVASQVIQLISGIYGTSDDDEVAVSVLG